MLVVIRVMLFTVILQNIVTTLGVKLRGKHTQQEARCKEKTPTEEQEVPHY